MTDEYEDKEDADAADFEESLHGVNEDGEPKEDGDEDELNGFRVDDEEEEEDRSF
jgi:hypothetical protein